MGTALIFLLLCGLVGEAFEILQVEMGGVAPLDWRLRVTLVVVYGLIGGAMFSAAAVFGLRRRAALTVATAAFAMFLLVPWLNLEYLPRLASMRSLYGTVLAALLLALAAPLVVRFGKVSAAAVVLAALVANGGSLVRAGDPVDHGKAASGGRLAANVVVVVVDAVRADHLGAYGYSRVTSRYLDDLAQSSVVFERAVAQAPWTKPSIASLLTGTYVHWHGVIASRHALGPELPTLAEELRRRGYRTAAFSGNPFITPEFRFDRGFDEFDSGRAIGPQLTNLHRLLKRAERLLHRADVTVNLTGWVFSAALQESAGNSERDAQVTAAVIEWLRENGHNPFFVYVHLMGAHEPYDPPAEFVRAFREAAWDGVPQRTVTPARVQSIFEAAAPLIDSDLAALVAQYDGAVAYSDAQVGQIIGELRRLNLLDKTLLVVTSDHGEEFYEHRNWRHGSQLYDEVVRVPLVMRLPGRVAPGRRRDPVMLIDIFPTVFGILGLPLELPHQDGRALFGTPDDPSRPVFSEHWRFEGGTYVSRMVLRDGLKLKETHDSGRGQQRMELYDLRVDAAEQDNRLAEENAGEKEVGELRELLSEFSASTAERPSAPSVAVDPSTVERLRALGY